MARSLKPGAFSILELLLALAVLAIAILAMITVFIQGLKVSQNSSEVATATETARETLERIRWMQKTVGFTAIPNGAYAFNGWNNDPPNAGFPPAPYPRISQNNREFVVGVYGTQPSAFLKSVRVEVYWKPDKKVVLETSFHP